MKIEDRTYIDSGVPGMLFQKNVQVTMTDGLQLRINVYRPDREGRFPVVMVHGPYSKDMAFAEAPQFRAAWDKLIEENPDLLDHSSGRFISFEAPDPERWVPDGYVVIHADSRGSGASPGFLNPFSPHEADDYATLITWASKQSWSNGKVGLLGISYYAINQWQVAARQPDGLAAIIPWEGAFDHYRDLAWHGGIQSTAFLTFWFTGQVVSVQNGNNNNQYRDSLTGQNLTGEPLPPHLLAANRVAPLDIYSAQPLDGAFWRERTADASRIRVPVLSVGNWGGQGLHLRGDIEGFLATASQSKWLRIHTGDHIVPFYREESLALQKRFFDRYLKGLDNGWESEPTVTLAIRRPDNVVEWRAETEWPLRGTRWEQYHLDASTLSMTTTAKSQMPTEVSYQAMSDGVTFCTAPFAEETEFTGPVKLRMYVKSSTTDMDIFATLRLLDPTGHDVYFEGAGEPHAPVSQGWLRVSHRELDLQRSTEYRPFHTHLNPAPLEPNRLYEVDVEIWATSVVVPTGYQLAITVQGRDWERPPDADHKQAVHAYEAKGSGPFLHLGRDTEVFDGTNTIATGEGQDSYLLLPRIPNDRA